MKITKEKLDYFTENIFEESFYNNNGGMGAPDLFTLYLVLDTLKPSILIESGVWNGISTKLIRKILPDSTIFCLDPREIPDNGFRDTNTKTIYYTGKKFVDFDTLDLTSYDPRDVFCFFDCHQNALLRTVQCMKKNLIHLFFNDNYPVNCGSHYTLEHFFHHDNRHYFPEMDLGLGKCLEVKKRIEIYNIFPNIYPGSIKTGEGFFECNSFYDKANNDYPSFQIERNKYRWNTYVKLRS